MKTQHPTTTPVGPMIRGASALLLLALMANSPILAQTAPGPAQADTSQSSAPPPAAAVQNTPDQTTNSQPVVLNPFEVSSDSNVGYGAMSTTSSARIAQNYIDVPQTVNVMTSEFINDYNILDERNLYNYVPNMVVGQNDVPGNNQIRGLVVGLTYIDGVVSASTFIGMPMQFYDRVEIVKGPSSAAFGIGQPGGIVNYVSKTPTGATGSEITVGGGDHNNLLANFDSQGHVPGHDNITYRAVAFWDKGDSYVNNEPHEGQGAQLAFKYDLTPTLSMQLITAYSDTTAPSGPDNTTTWSNEYAYTAFTDVVSTNPGGSFQELPGTNPIPAGTKYPGINGGTASATWAGGDLLGYRQQPLPNGWDGTTLDAFRSDFIIDKSLFDNQIHVRNTAVIEHQSTVSYVTQPTDLILTTAANDYLYDQPIGVYAAEYARNYGSSSTTQRSDNVDIDAEFDFGQWGKYTTLVGGDVTSTTGVNYGYAVPSIDPDGTIATINAYNINPAPAFIPTNPITGTNGTIYQPQQPTNWGSSNQWATGFYAQEEASYFHDMVSLMAGWRIDWSLLENYNMLSGVTNPKTSTGWESTKGAPRFAVTLKPLKWFSLYGLVTEHVDPTQSAPVYTLAARNDVQPAFLAQYDNFQAIQYYQPKGTLVEGGVKATFLGLTGSIAVFHEIASGQLLEVGLPPVTNPDGSESQAIENIIAGANVHGIEAELFGNITKRFSFIADYDLTRGSNPPFTNLSPADGYPGNMAPWPIDPPVTIMGHGKYDFGDLHGNGFYATFGAKFYGPYLVYVGSGVYSFLDSWQYTLDGGIGYRWDHGRQSVYLNSDNFTNRPVLVGVVQYYVMAPFEQAFLTYTRKF